tara:strand:- start:911 stop:1792 length:882 start_codon:yes stop_codon:yes gene_type:complete
MHIKKGIILAGGEGTRLHPITIPYSKQLLPVYDKPMIYYSLSTLMEAQIRDFLLISSPGQINNFKKLLNDGSHLGISIKYEIQEKPSGIAQAFIIGENFIKDESVALILGDNIFYGIDFVNLVNQNLINKDKANIFLYQVPDPEKYGVIEIDNNNKIISIEEKPSNPKSSFVVTGLYFYDCDIIQKAKKLKPSNRKELEITDINKDYLNNNKLNAVFLRQGTVWLDAGTTTSLLQASQFVQTIQERQQIQIGCPEEVSLKNKWISNKEFKNISEKAPKNSYGNYLRKISMTLV